jgi:hypothetical protein
MDQASEAGPQMDQVVVVCQRGQEAHFHIVDGDRRDDHKDSVRYRKSRIRHCSVCAELHQPVCK